MAVSPENRGEKRSPSPHELRVPVYRPSKARADCGNWLACANTDTPACVKIWLRVNSAVSAATSASLIRERAAEMFSDATCKLPMVEVNRFCTAPIEPRSLPICVQAKSIVWIASLAPDAVPILRVLICLFVEVKAPPPVVANPAPISFADVDTAMTEPNPTFKVSPALNVRDPLSPY